MWLLIALASSYTCATRNSMFTFISCREFKTFWMIHLCQVSQNNAVARLKYLILDFPAEIRVSSILFGLNVSFRTSSPASTQSQVKMKMAFIWKDIVCKSMRLQSLWPCKAMLPCPQQITTVRLPQFLATFFLIWIITQTRIDSHLFLMVDKFSASRTEFWWYFNVSCLVKYAKRFFPNIKFGFCQLALTVRLNPNSFRWKNTTIFAKMPYSPHCQPWAQVSMHFQHFLLCWVNPRRF